MMRARKTLLNPPMIVALMALFVSLSGVAWATVKIGTAQLKNSAVTRTKIRNSAVNSAKVADNSLTQDDLASGTAVSGSARVEMINTVVPTSTSNVTLIQINSNVKLTGSCSGTNVGTATLSQTGTGVVELDSSGIAHDSPVEPFWGGGSVSGGSGGIGFGNSSAGGNQTVTLVVKWGAVSPIKDHSGTITGSIRNAGTGCRYTLSAILA